MEKINLEKFNFEGVDSEAYTYLVNNYEFRYNTVKTYYQVREIYRKKNRKVYGEWMRFTDDYVRGIVFDIEQERIPKFSENKCWNWIKNERTTYQYNPFEDYFNNLKKWDGVDYIDELCKTVDAKNQEMFNKYFKKFLVSTVDCLLNEDAGNDTALIFHGEQGTGKTRWVRTLVPKALGREYIKEGSLDLKKNDDQKFLSTSWFINMDDLASMKTIKIEELKAFMTQMSIDFRQAFGKQNTFFVRRASFIGSTNIADLLTDTTGNRRFLVFHVNGLNYMHKVDIDGVWSQAFHLLMHDNFRGWLNPEEAAEVNAMNENFREVSEEEQRILANFQFCSDDISKGEYLNSSDIKDKLMSIYPTVANRFSVRNIGRTITKLCKEHNGHKKRDSIKGNVYKVNFIGIIPADEESTDKVFTSGTSTSFTKSTEPIAYQLPLNQSQNELSDDDLPF